MSIRTSFLRYCVPLALLAACSTDRVAAPPSRDITPRFSFTAPGTNGRMVFVSQRDFWFSPIRNQIYSVTAEGTDLVRLTGFEVEGDVWVGEHPAVSADGRKIAFSGILRTGEGAREIYTMNADGSGKTRLTIQDGDDMLPEWSPDGAQIAFLSSRSGDWQLWVMDTLGTNVRQLTVAGMEGSSSWSRDGTRIIYTGMCGDPLAHGLCSVAPDGGSPPVLMFGSRNGLIATPNWSPDGTKILFSGIYNGMSAIWTINPDGTGEHPLVTTGGGGARWSPDGTKIIFERSFAILVADAEGQNQNIEPFTTNDIYGPYNFSPYWGPAPPAPKQCGDGIDNDSDTHTDYPADPGCSSVTDDDETDPPPPPPVYQCSDEVDNDGDAKTDYPTDPGCSSATDDDETDPPPPPPTFQCNDGLDNDSDGKIDYSEDPGCASATDDNEADRKGGGGGGGGGGPTPKPPPQCSDGIDNDGDGNIDLADAQCRNSKDNDEGR